MLDEYEKKLKAIAPLANQFNAIREVDKVIENLESYDNVNLELIRDEQRRRTMAEAITETVKRERAKMLTDLPKVYPKGLF
jgi:hypothetical protein